MREEINQKGAFATTDLLLYAEAVQQSRDQRKKIVGNEPEPVQNFTTSMLKRFPMFYMQRDSAAGMS